MPEETLAITDNRTGKSYNLPITHGTIRAIDLRQIKVSDDDFGLMSYDPAASNTSSCASRLTEKRDRISGSFLFLFYIGSGQMGMAKGKAQINNYLPFLYHSWRK